MGSGTPPRCSRFLSLVQLDSIERRSRDTDFRRREYRVRRDSSRFPEFPRILSQFSPRSLRWVEFLQTSPQFLHNVPRSRALRMRASPCHRTEAKVTSRMNLSGNTPGFPSDRGNTLWTKPLRLRQQRSAQAPRDRCAVRDSISAKRPAQVVSRAPYGSVRAPRCRECGCGGDTGCLACYAFRSSWAIRRRMACRTPPLR